MNNVGTTIVSRPARPVFPPALAGAALVATALVAGCRGERTAAPFALDEATVARHVRYETGLAPRDIDRDGLARLRADLLGEALFARAAEREGTAVPPAALAKEAGRLGTLLGATAPKPEVLQEDARRRLLARIYDDRLVRDAVPTEPRDSGGAPPEGAPPPRVLRDVFAFRQICCETEDEARRIVRRLARGEAFEDLAREASTSPDRGRLLRRGAAELPDAVAEALRTAPEGGVTGPIESGGAYYVFALEGRVAAQDAPSPPADEWRLRSRRRAQDAARARRIAELAREEGVEMPPSAEPAEETRP